jgi:hypothetical protein
MNILLKNMTLIYVFKILFGLDSVYPQKNSIKSNKVVLEYISPIQHFMVL